MRLTWLLTHWRQNDIPARTLVAGGSFTKQWLMRSWRRSCGPYSLLRAQFFRERLPNLLTLLCSFFTKQCLSNWTTENFSCSQLYIIQSIVKLIFKSDIRKVCLDEWNLIGNLGVFNGFSFIYHMKRRYFNHNNIILIYIYNQFEPRPGKFSYFAHKQMFPSSNHV